MKVVTSLACLLTLTMLTHNLPSHAMQSTIERKTALAITASAAVVSCGITYLWHLKKIAAHRQWSADRLNEVKEIARKELLNESVFQVLKEREELKTHLKQAQKFIGEQTAIIEELHMQAQQTEADVRADFHKIATATATKMQQQQTQIAELQKEVALLRNAS